MPASFVELTTETESIKGFRQSRDTKNRERTSSKSGEEGKECEEVELVLTIENNKASWKES